MGRALLLLMLALELSVHALAGRGRGLPRREEKRTRDGRLGLVRKGVLGSVVGGEEGGRVVAGEGWGWVARGRRREEEALLVELERLWQAFWCLPTPTRPQTDEQKWQCLRDNSSWSRAERRIDGWCARICFAREVHLFSETEQPPWGAFEHLARGGAERGPHGGS